MVQASYLMPGQRFEIMSETTEIDAYTLTCLKQITGKGTDTDFEVARELRQLFGTEFPTVMRVLYQTSSKLGARAAAIYFSFSFASTSRAAREMALEALADKSGIVRYRACQLLAFGQDKSLLPQMYSARKTIAAKSLP